MNESIIKVSREFPYTKIFKGSHYYKTRYKNVQKVIAFDMDETLGSFVDLEILWRCLQQYTNELFPIQFNNLLDLYPEFLRYGIIPILEFLYQKKLSGECNKLYIYTNNQCQTTWTKLISNYFNSKVWDKTDSNDRNIDIFDKIIGAFKINNKQIELGRTSHSKTYSDFIKCTLLPSSTEICFIDNANYSEMKQERVYYIQPRSYIHHLSTKGIVDRFVNSEMSNIVFKNGSSDSHRRYITNYFNINGGDHQGNQSTQNLESDILVAQKMMYHLREFFYLTQRKQRTKKKILKLCRKTRKKIK